MPRDIPVGNGTLLIAFDKSYNIRDIYFPYVGKENHSEGYPFRFGVWVDGMFSWMGPEWQLKMKYKPDTLVTQVTARNERLKLELECYDAVDFHLNIYLKKIVVKNLADRNREVRLFFSHDFRISETEVGDTAYYDPRTRAVIHYKGHRYFIINCCDPTKCGVDHFATGKKGAPGVEGTWRDAEDGHLSGNAIAQGAVDSTIGINVPVEANDSSEAHYWMAAAHNYGEAAKLNKMVWDRTPEELLKRTENYWKLWVNKEEINFQGLPQRIVELFKQSLLIMRTQIDNHGAIIAANDSDIAQFGKDTYSYMWPRDGALAAYAIIKYGQSETAQRFFKFCSDVITPEGYLLHKYNPDGSVASSWHPWFRDGRESLPIQEDETALVVWALWKHFDKFRDVEFIKPFYRPLVINAADFMYKFRDGRTRLPLPSHDLWEERYGVHTYTVATVVAGLRAAGHLASAFGELAEAEKYFTAANEVKAAMEKHLYNPKEGRFCRMAVRNNITYDLDMNVDASICGVWYFGVFRPDDPKVVSTMDAIREKLWIKTEIGGVARYMDDYYHQVSRDLERVPGNPWIICTLWLAEYEIARAKTMEDLDRAMPLLEWVADHALLSGVLAEQVHPYTGEPLSVSPLTWSHATVVATVLEYLEKRRALSNGTIKLHLRSRYGEDELLPHSWEEPEQAAHRAQLLQ